MQSSMKKLNKTSISNINKHHQKTIDSYFCSVWYGEDIMIRLYLYIYIYLHILWCCEHMSLIKNSFILTNVLTIFYIKISHFLGNFLIVRQWDQNVILCRVWHLDNTTLSCATKCVVSKGEHSTHIGGCLVNASSEH